MFSSLRVLILQHIGLYQIIEDVLDKPGNVDEMYLNTDSYLGKNSPFLDLILVAIYIKLIYTILVTKLKF